MLHVFSRLRSFLVGQEVLEAERRKAVRVPCRFKAAVEGTVVNVVNISLLGMRVDGPKRWRKNVVVTVDGRDHAGKSLFARVAWCHSRGNEWTHGLMFMGNEAELNQSWVKTALDKLGSSQGRAKERRTHVRCNTDLPAALANSTGGRLCPGKLRNIGLGGALFLSEVGVQPGTPVLLQLNASGRPKLDEKATVRSSRKDPRSAQFFIGLQFAAVGSEAVRKFLKQR